MSTLMTPPLSDILPRLFADAAACDAETLSTLGPEERTQLMTSKIEYRALFSRVKNAYLAVSEETGKLLYMLVCASGARSIIEFGTSFGISTLHLAAALRDNGGGRLITTELETGKATRARENIAAAGLGDLVEVRVGDALTTIAQDLPDTIDFVLLDGAKALYAQVLSLLEPRLRAGALLVADNAAWSPEYLERVRAPGSYLSVPFGNDVELSMKIQP
jgi:predicted O-methyltransferase YrrM